MSLFRSSKRLGVFVVVALVVVVVRNDSGRVPTEGTGSKTTAHTLWLYLFKAVSILYLQPSEPVFY